MAVFQYTTLLQNGKEQKALIEADNEKQARLQIKNTGAMLVSIKPYHESSTKKITQKIQQWRFSITYADLALFTRQLATLLKSGIVLEEALQALIDQAERSKVKAILLAIKSKVMQGSSLTKALLNFPNSFPVLYTATISAGEKSGRLDMVLENLADYIDKQRKIKQQVYQALLYPILMTLVSLSIVFFLLVDVVPKMVSVFIENKQVLPLATTLLIKLSDFLQHDGIYLILMVLSVLVIYVYYYKSKIIVKQKTHQVLLKIPLIKKFIKQINTARYMRTCSILLQAGMPATEAMSSANEVVSNLILQNSLINAKVRVVEGVAIHMALKGTQIFSPMSLHLITSGEKSGQLEEMLKCAADNQDYDVEQVIKSILTLFEPVLILIMGGVVLFIVLAVLLPIFSMNQMI